MICVFFEEEGVAVKKKLSAAMFRLSLVALGIWFALPAWAHEGDDDMPVPPVNPQMAGASRVLMGFAGVLVVVMIVYKVLLSRGIIKSDRADRWE